MIYTWEMRCPRCKGTDVLTTENRKAAPVVNCGECLWNDTEVVELEVIRVEVKE